MGKSLFIAEKPSVAQEFSKALKENMTRHDGYQESDHIIVTWCVGHLVTMSYPEAYDEKYKKWNMATLPFIPDKFLFEVIPSVKKQFNVVKGLLNRRDVDTIYVCTDSGREGEYIYRLVAQMAGVKDKTQKRVWIDSQTEEEILRGIKTARDESAYDNLASAAYLRAEEDYLMGINFSRALTLKYGNAISSYLGERYCVIAVGRVMTCVLGMIVRREREIRAFVKTPFYRVFASLSIGDKKLDAEWRAVEGSAYFQSPKLYKENGFKEKKDAQELIRQLKEISPQQARIIRVERKTEKKNPPLLYNLAELQNDCSRMFKISPDQTLSIVQELYEKKLTTYPRTDARVLSSAVAKVIRNNITGLRNVQDMEPFVEEILAGDAWKMIGKTRYTNDKLITDHYALIPTGQGLSALHSLSRTAYGVYMCIVRRFLSIFYPPAQYKKIAFTAQIGQEKFFSSFRILMDEGYLKVALSGKNSSHMKDESSEDTAEHGSRDNDPSAVLDVKNDSGLLKALALLKAGAVLNVDGYSVKEGETSPPKRYNSGTMILAMENAGQLIEDETLREQIKGAGIGTSATRAEILKKLVSNRYVALNKKTQVLSPTLMGEMIVDVVNGSIRPLLSPELTASWEKGLNYVAEGSITPDEYREKLKGFVVRRTDGIKQSNNVSSLRTAFDADAAYYKQWKASTVHKSAAGRKKSRSTSRKTGSTGSTAGN